MDSTVINTGYTRYYLPLGQKKDASDTAGKKASEENKDKSEKPIYDFRQPFSFNDVCNNAYPSYNITTLPTYNQGIFASGTIGLPPLSFEKSDLVLPLLGSIVQNIKGGVGAEIATYLDSQVEAKRVLGAGVNASFYGATKKVLYQGASLYAQVGGGLSVMTFGDKYELHRDIDSLGVYIDDLAPFGRTLKFSPSFQIYGSANTRGGSESYKTLMGTEDLNDMSVLNKFNLRLSFLDLPNYLKTQVNFYGKWGKTAVQKNSNVYGVTFDNGVGLNANMEFWNNGGSTPLLNFALNKSFALRENKIKSEGNYINFSLGLKNLMDPQHRGGGAGVNIYLGKLKIFGAWIPVRLSFYYNFMSNDTTPEVEPGHWLAAEYTINNWTPDPSLGPNQASSSFTYTSGLVCVTPGNKMEFVIGTANQDNVPGIVPYDPDGNKMDGSVDVMISSVKVTDVTDMNNPIEQPDAGQEIVGRALKDFDGGGLTMELPRSDKNGTGNVRYQITITLSTDGSEVQLLAPDPCTTKCTVKVMPVRE